jgi:hypothetical protein
MPDENRKIREGVSWIETFLECFIADIFNPENKIIC